MSVFADRRQYLERPIFNAHGSTPFYDHKGFTWMALGDRLRARFDVVRTVALPMPWLGPRVATQVWFVARKRSTAA